MNIETKIWIIFSLKELSKDPYGVYKSLMNQRIQPQNAIG